MKKKYINPTLTVVKLPSSRIMAGSFKGLLGDDDVNGSVSLSNEGIFTDWNEIDVVIEEP